MKNLMRLLAITASVLVVSSALAAPFRVAAASSSGTYSQMLKQVIGVCGSDDFQIEEVASKGGATDNLEALVNNKVNAAFLHSDVIFYNAQSNPEYRNYKTLLALYPEEIHLVTLRNSKMKRGAVAGFGGTTVEFNSLADLKGYNVGAAGGGIITAKILTGLGEGGFHIVEYDSGKDVLPALVAGEIQAAIFVGGAPLPNIETLSYETYKLIPIGDAIANRLAGVYRPAIISYRNLKANNVKTLAPLAVVLTRQYKTSKMVGALAAFRQCFYDHLDELRETTGSHPKWQVVEEGDHGVWDWYELPVAAPARAAPASSTQDPAEMHEDAPVAPAPKKGKRK